MIKIKSILSEIKIIGKITPQIVFDLYIEAFDNNDIEVVRLFDERGLNQLETVPSFLRRLSQNNLKQLYLDLLKLK